MRTREEYSLEQRRVWKDRQVSETTEAQNKANALENHVATLNVREISQTEYQRAKSKRGVKLVVSKPNYFVVKSEVEGVPDIVHVTVDGKYYRGWCGLDDMYETLQTKEFLKPQVFISIHMVVRGGRWDDTDQAA